MCYFPVFHHASIFRKLLIAVGAGSWPNACLLMHPTHMMLHVSWAANIPTLRTYLFLPVIILSVFVHLDMFQRFLPRHKFLLAKWTLSFVNLMLLKCVNFKQSLRLHL